MANHCDLLRGMLHCPTVAQTHWLGTFREIHSSHHWPQKVESKVTLDDPFSTVTCPLVQPITLSEMCASPYVLSLPHCRDTKIAQLEQYIFFFCLRWLSKSHCPIRFWLPKDGRWEKICWCHSLLSPRKQNKSAALEHDFN